MPEQQGPEENGRIYHTVIPLTIGGVAQTVDDAEDHQQNDQQHQQAHQSGALVGAVVVIAVVAVGGAGAEV